LDPKVYIIIVNYNGWKDTIECLESVFRNNYLNFQVIAIDNGSSNHSIEKIKEWAEGKQEVLPHEPSHSLYYLSHPPVLKPIPYIEYTRQEAEVGGNTVQGKKTKEQWRKGERQTLKENNCPSLNYPLIIIQTEKNLGFAGGNNIGIKYALVKDDFEYIWLLNNDTVIDMGALAYLVEEAESYKKFSKKVGMIGSKLLYFDNPSIIQGVGGKYNKWFAKSKHIGAYEKDRGQWDKQYINFDYVIGASMLISKDFIRDIGLMCEDYFLYFEDVDLAIRGRQKGWILGYCCKSKVYHKEGTSIRHYKLKEDLSFEYLRLRNKIKITKNLFSKYFLTVVYMYAALGVIKLWLKKALQFWKLYQVPKRK